MSVLKINCAPTATRDISKVFIRDDHFNILKNGIVEGKLSIKECSWIADNVISYTINLPANSAATFSPDSISSETTAGIKMIVVKARNSMNSEKDIENDKLFYKRDTDGALPLGQLMVLSGSTVNRITGDFTFYNGTPNDDFNLIVAGVYDVTLDIIVAL